MKRILAALAACLSLSVQAANTFGTDISNLWYNPNESGWGVNIDHQQEILFITLFVYGTDGRVKWYVGPNLSSPGGFTFTGPFYETTGPYFGAATFNPNSVVARQVGTATATFSTLASGTLTYSVDGVTVTKAIQRQTFRTANLSGSYVGGLAGSVTGCANQTYSDTPSLTITHNGSTISMTATGSGGSCTYSGTYTQFGRMGQIQASRSCSDGSGGTILIFEIESGYTGFLAHYDASYGSGCRDQGKLGAAKR